MARFVTGIGKDGKAVFKSIGPAPRTVDHVHTPGFRTSVIWATPARAAVPNDGSDPTPALKDMFPRLNGTSMVIITIPPVKVMMSPDFDPAKALAEHEALSPHVAGRMDPSRPGMHATDTIDYVIVLDGEVWLGLDSGEEQKLVRHDVVIQNGTEHAWVNKSDAPVTLGCFLVGAVRKRTVKAKSKGKTKMRTIKAAPVSKRPKEKPKLKVKQRAQAKKK